MKLVITPDVQDEKILLNRNNISNNVNNKVIQKYDVNTLSS